MQAELGVDAEPLLTSAPSVETATGKTHTKASGKAFYRRMVADADYAGPKYNNFRAWLREK